MIYNAGAYTPLFDIPAVSWLIYGAFAAVLLFTALLPLFTSGTASAEHDAPDHIDDPGHRGNP